MTNLIFSQDSSHAKQLAAQATQHKLRRIYQGIYTDNLNDPIEKIIQQKWLMIVHHVVPKGILSFRTAFEIKLHPYKQHFIIFMTSTYTKTVLLPGLTIKIYKGNNQDYIEQLLPTIARSNTVRMLLENLSVVRSKDLKNIKTVRREQLEDFLAKEMRLRGERSLNAIRDAAKIIAEKLNFISEYKKLNSIISALLATHKGSQILQSNYATALVRQKPFDASRVQLLESLIIYLKKSRFLQRQYQYTKTSFNNLSFFESYFSNFIEGTEFIIDEAEDIVFQGKKIKGRLADSHDVLSNYRLSSDYNEITITPTSSEEFLDILQKRHAYLMAERSDVNPGQFKTQANKAGNTFFVNPEDVIGTLGQGFELYQILNDGLEKGLFMHFLISEVHPFTDGNGRLARIMMNAELVKAGLFKIIIPSVHRDNYLNGLRLVSRDRHFSLYCKVMDQAHAYTASIDWSDYSAARVKLEADNATSTADEGLPIFNRALRKLQLSELAI